MRAVSLLAGRTITGVAEGNTQLARFVAEIARPRPPPVLAHKTVAAVLIDEHPRLLTLVDPLADTDRIEPVGADRQAFIRFETNRYSVPTSHADRALTLVTDLRQIGSRAGRDELGYLPCDSRAVDILFNIMSRRHEQRSTVITTNLAFKQWGAVFPGAACIVALVDRFAQHCHKVDIDADSWHDSHPFERDDSPDKPASPPRRSAKKR